MKDLASLLRNIGGIKSLDSAKHKDGSCSGSLTKDVGLTSPVNDHALISSNHVDAEATDVEAGRLARKRKDHPEVGGSGVAVGTDAPSPKRVTSETFAIAPAPTTMKAWIASILAEDRRCSYLRTTHLLKKRDGLRGKVLITLWTN